MTASNARMFRVQLSDRPDDSALLSEAEIAELRAAFAHRQAETAAAPPAHAEPSDVDTMPDFTATDAEILASQKKPVATKDKPAQINQRLLIMIGGLTVALVLVALSLVSGSGRSAAPLLAPATAAASVAATAPPPTALPTVGADVPTVEAYFDYLDVSSSTAITITGMLRVDGKAGDDWRLVALSGKRSSVWVATRDVPTGLAVADPLLDLSPRPTSPPMSPARESSVEPPAPRQPPAPTPCMVMVYGNTNGRGSGCDLAALETQFPGGHLLAEGAAQIEELNALHAMQEATTDAIATNVPISLTATAEAWKRNAMPSR